MSKKVYIGGLPESCGPGDVLGALTSEADVAADKVGNIEIKGSMASVYITDDVYDQVAEGLTRVAASEVLVLRQEDPRTRFFELAMLVEDERNEEMKRHEREMRILSAKQRENEGRAVLHLKGDDEGIGLGGKHLVKFSRQKPGEQLPENEISGGDLVVISKKDPLRDDNPTGTVVQKTNYSLTVAFDRKPAGFVFGKGLRCDLHVNDITYQRQLSALMQVVQSGNERLRQLRDKVLGHADVGTDKMEDSLTLLDEKLNPSQREAVLRALNSRDFYLIHGPPGTGKTVTCVEAARQLVRKGEKVLCAADSNTAVDNLVQRLAESGEKVVRVGHPARVTPILRKHTLDELVQKNEKYQKSRNLRAEAQQLLDEQEQATHPGGRWRRGMSDAMIKSLAEKGKGSRGVPPDKIREMVRWLQLQQQIDRLFSRIDHLEEEAVQEILSRSDIVCATNSGCGSELLAGQKFDTVIIDEATQATEPSCWIPITLSDRVIMAGDHRQLPPTVLSSKAQGLRRTFFELLMDIYGEKICSVLEIQYRMNECIMQFSNREFYDGVLQADSSVARHTLDDLLRTTETEVEQKDWVMEAVEPDEPAVFLDTKNADAEERTRGGSTSKENPSEAEIAHSLTIELVNMGVEPRDIALIAPYDDQVDRLDRKIENEEIEVDTVDGFQGREKEVVVLSLVRSNSQGDIGFLKDVRRLNVSLTRAKRKLIIIGDSSTVGTHSTYERLLRYLAEQGKIIDLSIH